jgi:O-antigen/teichoic acid export membrane protein
MRTFVSSLLQIRFVRDIATMQVGKVIPMLCGFLASVLYTRMLGLGGYGEYAVVLTFTGMLGLFTNLGQQHTAQTFFAHAYGKGDTEEMRDIGGYYLLMSLGTIILLAICLPFLPLISAAIYHGDMRIGRFAQLVFLASMFDPLYAFTSMILQIVREIRVLTILENIYTVLQFAVGAVLLILGYGIAGILLGSLLTSVIFAAVSVVLYNRYADRHSLPSLVEMMDANRKAMGTFFRNGLWIAFDKNLSGLYPNLFLFLLSLQAGKPIVGLVRLAFKFASLPSTYVLSNVARLASTVVPFMAAQNIASAKKQLARLTRFTILLHLGVSIGTAIAVPVLFPVLYGKDFGIAIYPFFVIIFLHLSLAIHAIITPILRLYSKIHLAVFFNIAGMLIASIVFFLCSDTLGATRALYVGLFCYHVISLLILIPVSQFVSHPLSSFRG